MNTAPEQPENDLHATDATSAPSFTPADRPERIGRYRIEKVLGEGGFGRVYLARDDQLARSVAIKVAHRQQFSAKVDAEAYLAEARVLASLDHPNIVPVHDVGTTSEGLCYVVSKLVEGRDLSVRLAQARLTFTQAAELVATVAEALHYAHRMGLVHRDIKPANILIDNAGKAYVADFGLALKEQDLGKGHRFAGTPAYMSPEQARGEGHRVDGRSDVFSLGVVFYELLAGRRPFPAETRTELFQQIICQEARPLRQLDEAIPKELERICLKALAKRASERYLLAKDLAEELRQYLAVAAFSERGIATPLPTSGMGPAPASAMAPGMTPAPTSRGSATAPSPTPPAGGSAEQRPLRIVPKGLRSFDAGDADFFLELLPGPRDRDGLPESIRFWKSRIESQGGAATFAVGLVYGPSGCGKTSLVKAGLLPRLNDKVLVVNIEATAHGTETRLLKTLRQCFPATASSLSTVPGRGARSEGSLHETLAALRRGQGVPAGKKALIVIDQFEQWLHGQRSQENSELVQALRQCDGEHVQCIVMLRDDFWLGVSRFMRELEVELVEGRNMALVDLFDQRHAVKVLTAFGRAFAALPRRRTELTADQQAFLEQAADGLAQDRKVNCVRLALFAEMVKARPWTPATLKEMGGIAGVGAAFLEETFAAPTAPVQHRVHQKAAQAVLRALLPETGSDIKGQMQPQDHLLAVSGYAGKAKDFEALVNILDTELRLITPTEAEGGEEDTETGNGGDKEKGRQGDKETGRQGDSESGKSGPESSQAASAVSLSPGLPVSSSRFYQLTHDYLVPSLRDWLSRKDRESPRGRARLRLAELAAAWSAKPQTRHLPAWWEWLNIRRLTHKGDWTAAQRKMMAKAARFHVFRATVMALILAVGVGLGLSIRAGIEEERNKEHGTALAEQLLVADTAHVPEIIAGMAGYRSWVDPLLKEQFAKEADGSKEKLRAGLGLLPVDGSKVDYVYAQLLAAEPQDVGVLVRSLAPFKQDLTVKLWAALEQPPRDHESQRLRAACALAVYDPTGSAWPKVSPALALDLAQVPPVHLQRWMEALHPVRKQLVLPLAAVFRDTARRESERAVATDILADFAADRPALLTDLLMDADDQSFPAFFEKLKDQREASVAVLEAELAKSGADESAREKLAKRQANAAVALVRLNQANKVWPLLKHNPDPRVRSYLIHRLGPCGADAKAIVQRWNVETEQSVQRALILSLGAFAETDFPSGLREAVVTKLKELFSTTADPGLHAAAEWLLRDWKYDQWLKETVAAWAKDKVGSQKMLDTIPVEWSGAMGPKNPRWYVNGQAQTMVAIAGPLELMMGSSQAEVGRRETEHLHKIHINRNFAVAAKPVTLDQFLRFDPDWRNPKKTVKERAPEDECPAHGMTWSIAAGYCNWLSKREGIPEDHWCYVTNPQGQAVGMKPNYLHLKGYRLPTEAEMEYACRAGAQTSRFYGESAELLGHYAWYLQNAEGRSWPVGMKKPNDLGMFDMHGNIWCWCQDRAAAYPRNQEGTAKEDVEDNKDLVVNLQQNRVMRGGFYEEPPRGVRSAFRGFILPTNFGSNIGFRPARTL